MRNLLSGLRSLFRRSKLETDMAAEMCAHLEEQTARNLAAGMSENDARAAAHRQFGGLAQIQERARDVRIWVWMEQLMQDLRYATRQLRRNPGFTAAVVLILALGIGANTAVFSIVDALLFRPLPVRDPGRLLSVGFISPEGRPTNINISAPFFQSYREQSRSFAEFTGYAPIRVKLRAGENFSESATGHMVAGNYFATLGVTPSLGRAITAADDEVPGRDAVAVISYDCWQRTFSGDPDVIGQTLQANKQLLTIVGVAPPGFRGLNSWSPAEFWVPAAMELNVAAHTTYSMLGRLAPGITHPQAVAELDILTRQFADAVRGPGPTGYERYGTIPRGFRTSLLPAALGSWGPERGGRGNILKLAALFTGAVGLVLLVACANAGNLLLVRSLARRREIAVRLALGATRLRLLRQLVLESLTLSLLGALAGLLLARWGIDALQALRAGSLNYVIVDPRLDGRVLAFTIGLATITGLIFGLAPAARALRFDLQSTLKQEAPTALAPHARFAARNLLVPIQVAVGLVLLAGAGLCLRSFARLVRLDPGFDTRNVLTAQFSLDREDFPGETARSLVNQLLERLAETPGVRGVSLTNHMVPLSGNIMRRSTDNLEGYARQPGEVMQFGVAGAGPGYFRLLGIPVVQGREFDARDVWGRPEVALVNESFARRFWPGQNPLGKRVERAEVIGVVADSRSEQLWQAPEPQLYPALLQGDVGVFTLLVKTEGDPATFAPFLRRKLDVLGKSLKPARVETLESIWSASLAGQRMILVLLAVFSTIALTLAATGLYGFVAFSVAQRTREIGIRVAIGAQRRDIMTLVLRQGMTLVGAGLATGLVLALLATQALQQVLFEVTPTDAPTFVGVVLVLALVALLACWIPARRAAKVDPISALRAD